MKFHRSVRRFIPACAGNRLAASIASVIDAVHPRVCGEQSVERINPESPTGSSPRVRGTVVLDSHVPQIRRFIPACAGNSPGENGIPRGPAVHPRVCGEQHENRFSIKAHCGSSPRVRGTGVEGTSHSPPYTVHPRVCGEQFSKPSPALLKIGSSPRVRGTDQALDAAVGATRFIPACAGNSVPLSRWGQRGSVHPRVCGEQTKRKRRRWRAVGSSPRVRGTVYADPH